MLIGCGLMMIGLIWIAGGDSDWAWLLILACPLMHLFMAHGHSGEAQNRSEQREKKPENKPDDPTDSSL